MYNNINNKMSLSLLTLQNELDFIGGALILNNVIKNIRDYKRIKFEIFHIFADEKLYKSTQKSFYNNCQNSILLLNNLFQSYGLYTIFVGDIESEEDVDDFIKNLPLEDFFL
ncbi:hypothetical protein [Senegalia massiliensis]|uniref:Uncharacterized protein n=1 Tax=Senegalia massiliensis TaxID=1720316 RepID=A0A845QWC5_9CLOT|nr:hypothetical protein [Senegalia massiliensis]NBI06089.1 hypothetical protein [Senegalia massiliensis]